MATPRYGITEIDPNAFINAGPADLNASLGDIDDTFAGYSEGPLSSRPTSSGGSPGVAGRTYRATDTGQDFLDRGTGWAEIGGAGDIKATARATAPDGWLMCDGASVLRATYSALFAAIGTVYGSVDGTHFNLPNLKGKVPVGRDSAISYLDTLGESGGEGTHTLTTAEMPAHTHGTTTPEVTGTSGANQYAPTGSGQTGSTGGGGAHNNMQPYQVVNYLVKT